MAEVSGQAAMGQPVAGRTASAASPDKSATHHHLYEIDVIRSVTTLSVVGVHVVALTIILTHTSQGMLLQGGVVSVLHFTREIFVSLTSFVLVHGYAHRAFSLRTFAKKRTIGVLLPYVAWSILYEVVQGPRLPPVQWTLHLLGDLLNGTASFQLYYILLTLEFYLIFPWFLGWIQRAARHPWRLLSLSFAVQLILMSVEYQFVQVPPFLSTAIGSYVNVEQSRYLPLYQFYIILGGVAALYIQEMRAFLLRYGSWSMVALPITLLLLLGNMVYQVNIAHQSLDFATAVFQPAMPFYTVALFTFLYWIALRWAIKRTPHLPAGHGFWQLLSNSSFGVYLMQGFFITLMLTDLVPNMPVQWWEPLRVALAWLAVAVPCIVLSSMMLSIPGLSRLIGHPSTLQHKTSGATKDAALAADQSGRRLQVER